MKFEFSAGGVVYKKERSLIPTSPKATTGRGVSGMTVEILVCQHSQHHGWVFPKGFIGDKIQGETKEATALREVEEETGVNGKIIKSLTPSEYWYEMDGIKRKKTVYYFIMEYVGGDINKHDWEMENVEWLPVDKVEERLTYESDKKVWEQARKIIDVIASEMCAPPRSG